MSSWSDGDRLVWYVSYGSNLSSGRFRCYLVFAGIFVENEGNTLACAGRPAECDEISPDFRNTPACAGKTFQPTRLRLCSREHPRVRGEDIEIRSLESVSQGNTPACAGRTQLLGTADSVDEEHPRVRGEDPNRPGETESHFLIFMCGRYLCVPSPVALSRQSFR